MRSTQIKDTSGTVLFMLKSDIGLVSQFIAHAYNRFTNRETDDPLPLTVIIEDVNDNAPQFSGPLNFAVQEHCPMGK